MTEAEQAQELLRAEIAYELFRVWARHEWPQASRDEISTRWASQQRIYTQIWEQADAVLGLFKRVAVQAEDERSRADAARTALLPAPHAHSFWWSSSNTWTNREPPDDCRCSCGLSWGEVRAEGALS